MTPIKTFLFSDDPVAPVQSDPVGSVQSDPVDSTSVENPEIDGNKRCFL